MSPSAEQAEAPAAEAIVPAQVLQDGEVVLLAVKPSGWFVLLISWPVLFLSAAVAVGAYVAGPTAGAAGPAVIFFCAGAALLRLMIACFQWLAQVYVLTDKRVMRIRGMLKVEVLQCPLRQIERTELTAARGERFFSLATLLFHVEQPDVDASETAWLDLARPEEVKRVVDEAIHRARLSGRRKAPTAPEPEE